MTDNLAKHLLNDSEVLFETRDHRTLANLQESMVRECVNPAESDAFETFEHLKLKPLNNFMSVLPTF